MSRHLQILPSLRSAGDKLRQPAAGKENAEINVQSRKRNRRGTGEGDGKYLCLEEIGIESCETPKSEKNRIPETVPCPPAPRKPVRRTGVASRKRKLMPELEFFECDRRKEVDEFFRSSFERISAAKAKRNFNAAAIGTDHVVATGSAVAADSSSSSPA